MKSSHVNSITRAQLVDVCRTALNQGIPLDTVLDKINQAAVRQTITATLEAEEERQLNSNWTRKLPGAVRYGAFLLPMVFLVFGLYLVGSAVIPILGSYTTDSRVSAQVAPIPASQILDATPLFIVETASGESELVSRQPSPKVVDLKLDYTNLANWFASNQALSLIEKSNDTGEMTEYSIDIPTLNIEDAKVAVGGTDLNESLIAYPNTALPGQYGAPVVFGHSVLRQFYNPSPKNPRRYNSIFSTIMTLKEGKDKIYVTSDGVTYTYLVQSKTEVKPEDVYILNQQYDAKRLKLVTCTPEGTYLRRGVVTAQLIQED